MLDVYFDSFAKCVSPGENAIKLGAGVDSYLGARTSFCGSESARTL